MASWRGFSPPKSPAQPPPVKNDLLTGGSATLRFFAGGGDGGDTIAPPLFCFLLFNLMVAFASGIFLGLAVCLPR